MTVEVRDQPVDSAQTGGPDMAATSAMLVEQRQALYHRLQEGASGAEVLEGLTELIDGVIIGRYRNELRRAGGTLQAAGTQSCCLVALGGYGRREQAPYSDVDLMLLYRPEARHVLQDLIKLVLHPLWDLGLQVGHSVRTVADCLDLASTDLSIRTSMMEARFLAGSAHLYQEFHKRYLRKVVTRGVDRFIDLKLEERRREYDKFGETIYLLEPNVKKSKGGLRDLHVLQWAGMARFQTATIQELSDRGILLRKDYLALKEAREFLWRVRCLMHFHGGAAQEILSFEEQVWLAERFGFKDRPHLLAVEQFMQQYYQHTMGLHERSMRFVERCRSVPLWRRVSRIFPAPKVEEYFVVRGTALTVSDDVREQVLETPALLFKLFDVARRRQLTIVPPLLEDIHRHVETVTEDAFRTPEVSRIFLHILAGPGAARTLEAMHRAHLLEKIIPVFKTVRGLMQFNQYHKYTVDEHSLLAVAKAEALVQDDGMLGQVCREIHRKDVLHLAVLLHDLGKGQERDHSEVGKEIAGDTAARLGLDEQDARALEFLVQAHLLMAHTAFRRDPYDENVLLTFARAVGTPAVLKQFLILTAADIAAVGPGVLTKWKESLLTELYLRTLPEVSGVRETGDGPGRLTQLTNEVVRLLATQPEHAADASWVETQLKQFPIRYLYGTEPARIAAHLAAIRKLKPNEVLVEDWFNGEVRACEYTVITSNDLIPGIFSKIAGVLAAKGLQVLDAQIITREDGIVVDTFQVGDPDYAGEPSSERRLNLAEAIRQVLTGADTVDDLVRRSTRLTPARPRSMARQPTEVKIDNDTSDRFTIIDIFADDRQGLLYVITRAIFVLGLSVHAARISTRLDQVVDVFYITESAGGKVTEHGRLEAIRSAITQEIDRFLDTQMEESRGAVSE
jgi:[protein-PII] uridylyltransferase